MEWRHTQSQHRSAGPAAGGRSNGHGDFVQGASRSERSQQVDAARVQGSDSFDLGLRHGVYTVTRSIATIYLGGPR